MSTETMIDAEIVDHIDTLLPGLEKSYGKEPVKHALVNLYEQDPDQVLQWYLDDQLGAQLSERVKSYKKPEEDPSEVTIATVRDYISRRYPRYLEYANYHTSQAKLDQQGGDVLHEVMISVLLKDEAQMIEMFSKKKKQYRELDFYILRMIKLNCHSKTSPYRWKYRQPLIDGNTSVSGLNGYDSEAEDFLTSQAYEENEEHEEDPQELITLRFQIIRDILAQPQFTEFERRVFYFKFFLENSWKEWPGEERNDTLNKAYRSAQAKLIEGVDKAREEHDLQVIDQTFAAAKYMDLRIAKNDFLILRVLLSKLQVTDENDQPAAVTAPDGSLDNIRKFEKRLYLKLEQLITDYDINNKF